MKKVTIVAPVGDYLDDLYVGIKDINTEKGVDISNTPFQVLGELYEELLKVTDLAKSFNHSLLIALSYSDDDEDDPSLWFGTVDSEYSVEEYLMRA